MRRTGHGVTVEAYREADEGAVLALLTRAFGRWPTALDTESRSFFRWKHGGSPFGASVRLVARIDGEVVGFLALMPWRLSFAGTIHETFRGVDIAVAPAFQGIGVAKALIVESRSSYSEETALSWSNPNERSRPVLWKAGRKRVDSLPRYVGLGTPVAGLPRRLLGSPTAPPPDGNDAGSAAALADEPLLERVLTGPGSTGRISTAYDGDFLRWRYGGDEYRAVVGEHPRAGAGIAIFRTQMRGRFSVTRICELLTERDDERAERQLMRRVREIARTDFLICSGTSSRAAFRSGLVRSNRTATIAANPLRSDLMPDPTRASSWALSLGDLELI